MTDTPKSFRDDPENLRCMQVVQHAADTAYRARVAEALSSRFAGGDGTAITRARRAQGLSEDRWYALSQSSRYASSPAEFQAFARALSVSARWLAVGSGSRIDPPAGWYPFGTHIDSGPELHLDFSDEVGVDLLPLWERPVLASA